jgi:hypothetical protein
MAATSTRESAAATTATPHEAEEPAAHIETLVHGTLLGAEGKRIDNPESVWVAFIDASGNQYNAAFPTESAYAVKKLPFGKYWIHGGVHGYRTLEESFELERTYPQVQKDLKFRAATLLSVFVRSPDGRNLSDVVTRTVRPPPGNRDLTTLPLLIPVATRTDPGAWIPEIIGSANNHFGVGQFFQYGQFAQKRKEGSIGVLLVEEDLPVYASLVYGHAVLRTERVEPRADEVDFVIAADALVTNRATLKMRVLDSGTKEPIPNASASCTGGSRGGGGRADADGRITDRECEPGLFQLRVSAEGYETLLQPLQLDPGKTMDLGEILLGKGIPLKFRVLDDKGKPCATYFQLGIVDPATLKTEIDGNDALRSNDDGELTLPPLGRRLYVLRARMANWQLEIPVSRNLLIDLRAGILPPSDEIRLERGSRLVLRTESPWTDGLRFRVIDEQGLEFVSGQFHGNAPHSLSIPQGTYRVELLDHGGEWIATKSVTLASVPATVEFSH